MARPPRPPTASVFDRHTLGLGCLHGSLLLALLLAIYGFTLAHGKGAEDARALTFTTLVVTNLGLIFVNRSHSRKLRDTLVTPNAAWWWIGGLTLLFLGLVQGTATLRALFYFDRLHWDDLAFCLGASLIVLGVMEALKRLVPERPALLRSTL